MKNIFYMMIATLSLSSCMNGPEGVATVGHKAHFKDITDNEDAGLRAVLNLYGGKCKYSSAVYSSEGAHAEKYFEMDIMNSKALNQRKDLADLSTSNIAFIFYNKLGNDKKKYSEIRAKIIFDDDDEVSNNYPDSVLEIVDAKLKVVDGIVNLMKNGDYSGLADTLNDSDRVRGFDKSDFMNHLKQVDETLGNINQFVLYGFSFFDSVGGKPLLHIAGLMRRDKKSNEFSVNLDPAPADHKAIMINYKL